MTTRPGLMPSRHYQDNLFREYSRLRGEGRVTETAIEWKYHAMITLWRQGVQPQRAAQIMAMGSLIV